MLALIIPLSAKANFFDSFIDPVTLRIATGSGTLGTNGDIRNNPVNRYFYNLNTDQQAVRSSTFITANTVNAGEARLFLLPFTEFGMAKNFLEPGTMLLLGSCLLGLGLFAIKFKKWSSISKVYCSIWEWGYQSWISQEARLLRWHAGLAGEAISPVMTSRYYNLEPFDGNSTTMNFPSSRAGFACRHKLTDRHVYCDGCILYIINIAGIL